MEAASSRVEILDSDYNGMAISATIDSGGGKHEYNAHFGGVFKYNEDDPDAREIDTRFPANICALASRREIEAWIDGYQQGASDNR